MSLNNRIKNVNFYCRQHENVLIAILQRKNKKNENKNVFQFKFLVSFLLN